MVKYNDFPFEENAEEGLLPRSQVKRAKRGKRGVSQTPRNPTVAANHLEKKNIVPKSENQREAFDAYKEGYNLLLHGVAGTGKTFIALNLALESLGERDSVYKKIVIIRSAVQGREQGFMPGNEKEKASVFEAPYQGIMAELFGRDDAYALLKNKKIVNFITTSFVRGITISDSIVIVDEFQNFDAQEIHSVLSRLGKNSKLIICGDHYQDDLTGKKSQVSGLKEIVKILDRMNSIAKIEFGVEDIQRSGFVKEYLTMRLNMGIDKPLDI